MKYKLIIINSNEFESLVDHMRNLILFTLYFVFLKKKNWIFWKCFSSTIKNFCIFWKKKLKQNQQKIIL